MVCIVPLASNSAETELLDIKVPCTDTKIITERLVKDYREMPFIIGKAADAANSIMSLWINPTTKSWTIIATLKDTSCVIGVGDNFQLAPINAIKSSKTL